MLYRKISAEIENHLLSGNDKILVVEGARQVGKSYIIRKNWRPTDTICSIMTMSRRARWTIWWIVRMKWPYFLSRSSLGKIILLIEPSIVSWKTRRITYLPPSSSTTNGKSAWKAKSRTCPYTTSYALTGRKYQKNAFSKSTEDDEEVGVGLSQKNSYFCPHETYEKNEVHSMAHVADNAHSRILPADVWPLGFTHRALR